MGATAQYWLAVAVLLAGGGAAVLVARRVPASRQPIGRVLAAVLAADVLTFLLREALGDRWNWRSSLPLDLCDLVLLIAAVTCWLPRWRTGMELTWFWGMAGTLQAVVTPDLSARFPSLDFVQFVVGHVGIVLAALYLVVGLDRRPGPGAVRRVFLVTLGYAAVVGVVDAITGANYFYLRHRPAHTSLLSVLGPWPYYIASAAVVALVLFFVLNLPFRRQISNL